MKKIIFVLIVGAIVLPMFLKGPDGQPIMSLSDWIPETPDISGISLGADSGSSGSSAYYRYKDSQGNWQYSDEPPANAEFELVEVDTNANIIQSIEQPKEEVMEQQQVAAPKAGVTGYVDNMQNVMQDAQDVQGIMDGREAQLQERLNQ